MHLLSNLKQFIFNKVKKLMVQVIWPIRNIDYSLRPDKMYLIVASN